MKNEYELNHGIELLHKCNNLFLPLYFSHSFVVGRFFVFCFAVVNPLWPACPFLLLVRGCNVHRTVWNASVRACMCLCVCVCRFTHFLFRFHTKSGCSPKGKSSFCAALVAFDTISFVWYWQHIHQRTLVKSNPLCLPLFASYKNVPAVHTFTVHTLSTRGP